MAHIEWRRSVETSTPYPLGWISYENWPKPIINPLHLALSRFYKDANDGHPATVICFCCDALWRFGGISGEISMKLCMRNLLRFHTLNCMWADIWHKAIDIAEFFAKIPQEVTTWRRCISVYFQRTTLQLESENLRICRRNWWCRELYPRSFLILSAVCKLLDPSPRRGSCIQVLSKELTANTFTVVRMALFH